MGDQSHWGQPLLTASAVSVRLGVSRQRVYELARLKILPAVGLGRSVRFAQDAVEEFIKDGGRRWEGGWRRKD